ncbi:hypothetical protein MRX96_004651 [Rhipicephalus microplus]
MGQHNADTVNSRVQWEKDKEIDWQAALTVCQKKALGRAREKAMTTASTYGSSIQHPRPTMPPPITKKARADRFEQGHYRWYRGAMKCDREASALSYTGDDRESRHEVGHDVVQVKGCVNAVDVVHAAVLREGFPP